MQKNLILPIKNWGIIMPTYDYKCSDCDYSFEVFQKITEDPLQVCPECSGKLKRLIGPGAGPIFKGSGFYQTDYKTNIKPTKTESKSTDKKTESAPSEKSTVKKDQKSTD
jgi:putative FmdB family regulatory protein